MKKKFTIEEIIEIVNKFDYELVITEYKNNSSKLTFKDKEGYYYYQSLNNLTSNHISEKFNTSNKYTIQNIRLWLKLNNIDLILLSTEYKGNHYKLNFIDFFNYQYSISLDSLVNRKVINFKKFSKSNIYTIPNIKLWLTSNNKPFKLISDVYKGYDEKLQYKCLNKSCGEFFQSSLNHILNGEYCGYCDGKQVGLSNCLATKNQELAKEWHPTLNGDLTPYDVTCGCNKEVWWLCLENSKHEWNASPNTRTKHGCPYCSHQLPSEDYNLLVCNPKLCEEWNYNKNHKNPEEYCPGSDKYIWWICKECEHEWYASIGSRNIGNGCPECSKSKGEKECKRVFISNHYIEISQEEYDKLINKYDDTYFIPQKTFDGLLGLGGKNLSYDFYIPKYNILIEYQGKQHEKYIKGFHKSKKDFLKQKEHDRRKKEYTEQNEYNFLEIWYWDYDKIEEILESKLKELSNNDNSFNV